MATYKLIFNPATGDMETYHNTIPTPVGYAVVTEFQDDDLTAYGLNDPDGRGFNADGALDDYAEQCAAYTDMGYEHPETGEALYLTTAQAIAAYRMIFQQITGE